MSNFWQRTIFGAIYVLALLVLIFAGKYTFGLLMVFLGTYTLKEFYNLFLHENHQKTFSIWVILGMIFLIAQQICKFTNQNIDFLHLFPTLLLLPFLISIFRKSLPDFYEVSKIITGYIYAFLPFVLFTEIAYFSGTYLRGLVIPFFIFIWVNDSMAYVFGRLLGRNKFFPHISPNKTWEGTIGGVICTMLIAFFAGKNMHQLSPFQWMIFAGIIAFFGTFGDLAESILKRNLGIKDSGKFIPGHGGYLDRLDSFLFAVPFLFFYLSIISN